MHVSTQKDSHNVQSLFDFFDDKRGELGLVLGNRWDIRWICEGVVRPDRELRIMRPGDIVQYHNERKDYF